MGDRTDSRDYSRAIDLFASSLQPRATVLDIGCGTGQHMLLFREMGYDVVGIDPSERMCHLASS